jgi:hypothetical protein
VVDQALTNIDKWNRIMLRNLGALRDLRRSSVVINNAGQVNIGERQITVTRVSEDKDEEA